MEFVALAVKWDSIIHSDCYKHEIPNLTGVRCANPMCDSHMFMGSHYGKPLQGWCHEVRNYIYKDGMIRRREDAPAIKSSDTQLMSKLSKLSPTDIAKLLAAVKDKVEEK